METETIKAFLFKSFTNVNNLKQTNKKITTFNAYILSPERKKYFLKSLFKT